MNQGNKFSIFFHNGYSLLSSKDMKKKSSTRSSSICFCYCSKTEIWLIPETSFVRELFAVSLITYDVI